MRTLVHLRHGEREPGGVHLTPRGAQLAAQLGRRLQRFDRVITSPKPRAVETAEAMGYAVDAELPELGGLPAPIDRWVDREDPRSFADYVALVDRLEEVKAHAQVLAGRWRDEAERVPEGGRLLLVSHGGIIELGAVGALGALTSAWGPTLGLLDGVELDRDRSGWCRGAVVRSER